MKGYKWKLLCIVDYLGNVLEELGLCLSENLQHMSLLLRLPSEDYQNGSSGCNARVVAAVRQMRNITSSGWHSPCQTGYDVTMWEISFTIPCF